jgi:hypothetical protein
LGLLILRISNVVAIRWRVTVGGMAAWYSYILLDSMYNHGYGIRIYWPFGTGSLVLTVPWFSTVQHSQSLLNMHNLQVFAIEFACYMPLLAVVMTLRRMLFLKSRALNRH